MANDVSIIVEASLGDTLVKLELAKRAVNDLGVANAESAVNTDKNTTATSKLSTALGFLTGNWKLLVPVMAGGAVALLGFTGNMSALLPMVPVLTVALAGLLAPFTSLAAVFVALVAPVSLIVGLLGLLGAGFFLAAKQAFGKGGSLADALAGLKKQFHELLSVLVQDFMPVFKFLVSSASDALSYFTKLAHLNLKQAFDSLSTTGVEGLTHFLDKIGGFLAKPIRLAFDIAFGPQGGQIRNSMLKIWTQIQAFFEKPPSTGGPSISQEVGAWFGRQDFTSVGMRWASELAGALVGALGAALKKAMSTRGGKFIGGGMLGGAAIGAALGGPIGAALGAAIGVAAGIALNHYWPRIQQAGIDAFHAVERAARKAIGPGLWNQIISLAKSFWDWISGIGHVIATVLWPAVKKVWDQLGGWHTVLVIVVGVIRVIVAAFVGVGVTVRAVYDFIKNLWQRANNFANLVGGAVLSAWNAVAAVVGGIVTAIGSAVGAAHTLAGALGGFAGTITGPSAPGGRPVPVLPGQNPSLLGANFHFHAAAGQGSIAERAAFQRFVRHVGAELGSQQARLV